MKILLSGFEPFDGEDINPSLEAIRLVKEKIKDCEIVKLELPVVFNRAVDIVCNELSKNEYDAVLMIGQAGGRKFITPERVAININDARIKDNEGNKPTDEIMSKDSPAAYFSTLPIRMMLEYMKSKNIPCDISNSAGTFVCNNLMFGVLDYISKNNMNTIAGFMHVPYVEDQIKDKKDMPYLKMDIIVEGIEACIEAIIDFLNN